MGRARWEFPTGKPSGFGKESGKKEPGDS